MRTSLSHLLFNVRAENLGFYKNLLGKAGWRVLMDTPEMLGMSGTNDASLWFGTEVKAVTNDYDGPGMNHVGLGAESIADVDAMVSYLKEQQVATLFETPRHRPEFSQSADNTYYQVMFESPDRILWEVVYIGPK